MALNHDKDLSSSDERSSKNYANACSRRALDVNKNVACIMHEI